MERKNIFLICLLIYLIIVFSVEFAYRNVLYEKSIEYIEKIYQGGFNKYFYFFWSYIYMIGVVTIGILITLFHYPINIFFCHFSFLIFDIFLMSIFKSLYSNPRPYWDIFLKMKNEDEKLPEPTECNREFGNPSGHSILNMYSLILWHLFTNSNFVNKIENSLKKNIVKYCSLVITLVFMSFVIYSRIHRQMHSFNQIMHGTLIGFAIFFTFCYIIEYHKINLNDFIMILNKYKFIIIPILIVLFAISQIFGVTLHNDKEDEYEKLLIQICKYNKHFLFGKTTAFLSLIIFLIIGGYFGFLYMNYKNSKNKDFLEKIISKWNKGKVLHSILIALLSFIAPVLINLSWVFIPFSSYVIKLIIALICIFAYGFLSIGPCFCFACEKFKKSENEIEESLMLTENNN